MPTKKPEEDKPVDDKKVIAEPEQPIDPDRRDRFGWDDEAAGQLEIERAPEPKK